MSARKTRKDTARSDWRDLDLGAGGRSLIEASAGTGKTWTIAVLYLRLILEREFSPRQIVVTTFTKAAAQELRERLRSKLRWAERLAVAGDVGEEPLNVDEAWLRARWANAVGQRNPDLQRIRLAIAEMDVAPVSTMHVLCGRILADHPFACAVPFARGDLVDGQGMLEEIARDLMRRFQQSNRPDELVDLQQRVAADLKHASLLAILRTSITPGTSIPLIEQESPLPVDELPALRTLVADSGAFRKDARLRRAWERLAELIEDPTLYPDSEVINDLKGAADRKGLLKGRKDDADVTAIVELSLRCAPLLAQRRQRMLHEFWHKVVAVAREQIEARLRSRHQQSFDSLLTSVAEVLEGEAKAGANRTLADALFASWPVALIDEFQDTDSVQYGILDRIYRDDAGAPRGRLVMIGDPKQAIYRFRGGDIHAYQAAAAEADADGRLSLDTNHRSSRAYVDAINEWFACAGESLSAIDEESPIRYHAVNASDRRDSKPYTIDGLACAKPLLIHYRETCPDAAAERRNLALETCANQIVDLLESGRHKIGKNLLKPSDIAVLLPTAASIRSLRDLLRQRGVPCVATDRSSVYATDIARELQIILHALIHHTELGAARAAAATRLWGASFSELQRLSEDVAAWKQISDIFRRWHGDWHERGIQAVIDALIEHMAGRYLDTLGGERAITDLRHLGELLQEQSQQTPGSEELLAWFADQRKELSADNEDAADAAQLRIESDSERVALMTLHASKGLEFPIVFLPLMWAHGERRSPAPWIVNSEGRRQVSFAESAKDIENADLQDERFRVLYVAMTRAIHACHVLALPADRPAQKNQGPAAGTTRSALDVLIARMQPAPGSAEFAGQAAHVDWIAAPGWRNESDDNAFYQSAEERVSRSAARIIPPRTAGPIEARHSFTTLTRHHSTRALDPEASAGDEASVEGIEPAESVALSVAAPTQTVGDDEAGHPLLLALEPVKGADFGNAIHAMFEHREIGVPFSAQHELLAAELANAGVRRKGVERSVLVEALGKRLQSALEASLGAQGAPTLCLADLGVHDLLAEMEFFFPLQGASMSELRRVCAEHGEPDLVPSSSRTLSGLMNGKIDLIFHHAGRYCVLDYKGNFLGTRITDYQGERLLQQMDASNYRFQALLYCVALDRYLAQRIGHSYDRASQLGECFYLFVRAVGLGKDAGIWRHRFPDALLAAVGEVLDSGIIREVA
ncbi:MAG TPA: UvrD-helicase domain-containing protein [Dokdonella sp.]|uniref:UvrD-helicase domain-containing protein n=1 Tax=Dokdonella sp. TaxID=2291710 RepID=UPI002D7E5CE1|nr:UvrD-helicase domain-containing protein [Dokdonella sp.]HET9033323.1 UvrD-helicase domain-containing protein [Dokdonella sp.]